MKKVIIIMLLIPTLSLGMLQPQKHASNWISRQANRWMNRYMQQKAYTAPQTPRLTSNATGLQANLETELAQVQAKRKQLFDNDMTKTWNEEARQVRLLENAYDRRLTNRWYDKIFPRLKIRRTERAMLDIKNAHENLSRLHDRAKQNTAHDFELKKGQYYLQDLLFDIEKKKFK